MRIGVLSDTHIHLAEEIPAEIITAFSKVDLIVHAGDFVGSAVLDGLKKLGEVKAVCGNVDSMKLRSMLPEKDILWPEVRKLGLPMDGAVRHMHLCPKDDGAITIVHDFVIEH